MENNPPNRKKYRKPFSQLKKTQRNDRKRQMESQIRGVTDNLPPDVKKVKVDLYLQTGETLTFFPKLEENDVAKTTIHKFVDEEKQREILQQVLYVKDKYRISDTALHELHMICEDLPTKNKIEEEKKRLNSLIHIYTRPGADVHCSERTCQDILEYLLTAAPQKYLTSKDRNNKTLLLRFSFDGAKMSKKLNSVRGVFKILQDRENLPDTTDGLSMSPEDEHTMFLYLGDEARTTMDMYARKTLDDMARIAQTGIEVGENTVNVQWLISCDWKAAAILKGINAANSDYFCLWCHCRKSQICDFSVPSWPVQRSREDQQDGLERHERGYILPDMCPEIPYTDLVPDDLHMRIRISLKLFNQVVTWTIDQKRERLLQNELKRIGVPFHFWEERGDDNSGTSVKKWTQPAGDELKIIIDKLQLHNVLDDNADRHIVSVASLTVNQLKSELEKLNLSSKGKKADLVARLKTALGENATVQRKSKSSRLQVTYEYDDEDDSDGLNIAGLQDLWTEFGGLMASLRHLPSTDGYKEPETFMKDAREWAQNFRRLTFDEDVTPYIHAMVYHMPFFLRKYKYLHDIGVSQVERKNYDQRQAYFGSTNRNGSKHKQEVSHQILQRENRLLWAACEDIQRKKRRYRKSNDQT